MENLSYVQQYFICIVNRKGKISTLDGVSIAASLVMGEIAELISRGYIVRDEKNKISIVKPSDDGLVYLKPLYEAIAYFGKPEEIVRIVDMYASNVRLPGNYRKPLDDLLAPIGKSLAEVGCAEELPKKGMISKESKYAPKPEIATLVIEKIRMEFLENNVIENETLCLAALLDKSNTIPNYFSASETTLLKYA